jgi:K+-transporting ATPase ATPase C chain
MRRQLITGLRVTVALLVLCSVIYPFAVWAVGQLAFSQRADGSLVRVNGKVVGSALIGQLFSDKAGNPLAQYFQPRPSAAGNGYDPTASGGTNLGPSNVKLLQTVAARVEAYREFNRLAPGAPVPVDAVTASGSGLDPDISEANALDQAPRVALARRIPLGQVVALVGRHTNGRQWGILGEKTVNVLDLNLALDRTSSG